MTALVLLGDVGDLQVYGIVSLLPVAFACASSSLRCSGRGWEGCRTRGQALLELLGLVGVLKHQGVEMLLAADLELDVANLLVLLDPGGCNNVR